MVMSRDHFEAFLHCLHYVDNSILCSNKDNRYDKIGKVRWILEHFVERSHALFNLEKFVTVDEVMIAYHGHFSLIMQYMKSKPTHYSIKY